LKGGAGEADAEAKGVDRLAEETDLAAIAGELAEDLFRPVDAKRAAEEVRDQIEGADAGGPGVDELDIELSVVDAEAGIEGQVQAEKFVRLHRSAPEKDSEHRSVLSGTEPNEM